MTTIRDVIVDAYIRRVADNFARLLNDKLEKMGQSILSDISDSFLKGDNESEYKTLKEKYVKLKKLQEKVSDSSFGFGYADSIIASSSLLDTDLKEFSDFFTVAHYHTEETTKDMCTIIAYLVNEALNKEQNSN